MYIDKDELNNKLNNIEKKLSSHALPTWDELPKFELYMDQIISILGEYLSIYYETISSNQEMTSTMVNNYVKLKIIPAPDKKKYARKHVAFLIIVFVLKQTLDMSTIQKIIPYDTPEDELKVIYDAFVYNQHKSYLYAMEKLNSASNDVMNGESPEGLSDLLLRLISSANIFKIVTEQLSDLVK